MAAPLFDCEVALVAPVVAGFLMGVKDEAGVGALDDAEDVDDLGVIDAEFAAALAEGGGKFVQSRADEVPVPGRGVGLTAPGGFDGIKGEKRTIRAEGGGEGGVIAEAKVTLEPENLKHAV